MVAWGWLGKIRGEVRLSAGATVDGGPSGQYGTAVTCTVSCAGDRWICRFGAGMQT